MKARSKQALAIFCIILGYALASAKVVCPYCSYSNEDTEQYCLNCAKEIRKLSDEEKAKLDSADLKNRVRSEKEQQSANKLLPKPVIFRKPLTTIEELYSIVSAGGNIKKLEELISKGVSLETQFSNGQTPLAVAIGNGQYEIVKYLLKKNLKTDWDNPAEGRSTALYLAAGWGHLQIVKLLLDHGLNPNGIPGDTLSPLNSAIVQGHKDIVSLLLEKGANQILRIILKKILKDLLNS